MFHVHVVIEAYTAAMYSMARLNKTGARLMNKYGTIIMFEYVCIYYAMVIILKVLMEALMSLGLEYLAMSRILSSARKRLSPSIYIHFPVSVIGTRGE